MEASIKLAGANNKPQRETSGHVGKIIAWITIKLVSRRPDPKNIFRVGRRETTIKLTVDHFENGQYRRGIGRKSTSTSLS